MSLLWKKIHNFIWVLNMPYINVKVAGKLTEEQRKKIALFTNVKESAVIEAVDQEDIYSIPAEFHKQNLDGIVIEKLNFERSLSL